MLSFQSETMTKTNANISRLDQTYDDDFKKEFAKKMNKEELSVVRDFDTGSGNEE